MKTHNILALISIFFIILTLFIHEVFYMVVAFIFLILAYYVDIQKNAKP